MNAISKIGCALLLAGGLSAPAFAATNSPGTGAPANDQSAMPNPSNMHLTQTLRDDLSKAGFTDIKIMPSSFLVRAKDSEGNPVMMVINPDSVTAFTEQRQNAPNSQASGNGAATKDQAPTGAAQPAAK